MPTAAPVVTSRSIAAMLYADEWPACICRDFGLQLPGRASQSRPLGGRASAGDSRPGGRDIVSKFLYPMQYWRRPLALALFPGNLGAIARSRSDLRFRAFPSLKHKPLTYTANVRFEWNEDKNLANQRKHGVSFEEAQSLFTSNVDYLEIFDPGSL